MRVNKSVCWLVVIASVALCLIASVVLFTSSYGYNDIDSFLEDTYCSFQRESETNETFFWRDKKYELYIKSLDSISHQGIIEIVAGLDFHKSADPVYIYTEDEHEYSITETKADDNASVKYSLWSSKSQEGIILVIPYKRIRLFEHHSPFCYLLVPVE